MSTIMSYKRELGGICALTVVIFLILSCATYQLTDPSFFHTTSSSVKIANICGAAGAYTASMCFYLFGGALWIFIASMLFFAYLLFFNIPLSKEVDRCCAWFFLIHVIAGLCALYKIDIVAGVMPGGVLGTVIAAHLVHAVEFVGATLLLCACAWACIVILLRSSLVHAGMMSFIFIKNRYHSWRANKNSTAWEHPMRIYAFLRTCVEQTSARMRNFFYATNKQAEKALTQREMDDVEEIAEFLAEEQARVDYTQNDQNHSEHAAPSLQNSEEKEAFASYNKPYAALFNVPAEDDAHNLKAYQHELAARARILEEKLGHFGVQGSVVSIQSGPVVTLFEYQPHIETKVSKIIALEHDLALALQAISIRILAPIPGRQLSGLKLPIGIVKKFISLGYW